MANDDRFSVDGDRSFDDLADKFCSNIYGTRKVLLLSPKYVFTYGIFFYLEYFIKPKLCFVNIYNFIKHQITEIKKSILQQYKMYNIGPIKT